MHNISLNNGLFTKIVMFSLKLFNHSPLVQLGRTIWVDDHRHPIATPVRKEIANARQEVVVLLTGHDSHHRAIQPEHHCVVIWAVATHVL